MTLELLSCLISICVGSMFVLSVEFRLTEKAVGSLSLHINTFGNTSKVKESRFTTVISYAFEVKVEFLLSIISTLIIYEVVAWK